VNFGGTIQVIFSGKDEDLGLEIQLRIANNRNGKSDEAFTDRVILRSNRSKL